MLAHPALAVVTRTRIGHPLALSRKRCIVLQPRTSKTIDTSLSMAGLHCPHGPAQSELFRNPSLVRATRTGMRP